MDAGKTAFWIAAVGLVAALPLTSQDNVDPVAAGLASPNLGPYHVERVVAADAPSLPAGLELARAEDGTITCIYSAFSEDPLVLVVANDGAETLREELTIQLSFIDYERQFGRMPPPTVENPTFRRIARVAVEVEPGRTARYELTFVNEDLVPQVSH